MWDGSTITAIAGLLTAIGTGIAWWVRTRASARPGISRQAAEVAQASDAVGGALATVQASLEQDLQRVRDDYAEDREAWAVERAATRERIDALEAITREHAAKIDALRRTEGRLVGWVGRLHTGITDGSIPPLPDVPGWLHDLLDRNPDD
ncbi:MAG: hypothetical protein Q4F65_05585 [Propionibacteriaceae bacterium]|nr:hypothetical protein [Propionibacteriaceae bacterium]